MSTNNAKHQDGAQLLAEMDKTIPQKLAVCAAHMMLEKGSVVLDAGCANGMTTAYFALRHPDVHVIGVDYDSEYIRIAREKFGHIPNLKFIEGDLTKLDLGDTKLDAILNLSILHEPYSYTGYRKKTIEDIIAAELKNLKPGGVIINRDFMLPENPDQMVYVALPGYDGTDGEGFESLSTADFFVRYSQEAMSFNNHDPKGHIKGFFTEEHTRHLPDAKKTEIPEGWRVFSVQHQFAWEFIWRMHYRARFVNEAEEKYGFWTHQQHRAEPEKLGARVVFSAPYENPWLMENRYAPNARLFDAQMNALPLPPTNFISVLQKIEPGQSIMLREHRIQNTTPSYLNLTSFRHEERGTLYDLVQRPGGDIVDILPYMIDGDEITVYARDSYPRPIVNTKPRMMSPNLDDKRWSGHMIEPLASANTNGTTEQIIHSVLCDRAGFNPESINLEGMGCLHYYPAPSELNERVHACQIEVSAVPSNHQLLAGEFSGFSNDGYFRGFNAQSLLQAAQVGMLPDARLETNIYALLRRKGVAPKEWLGQQFTIAAANDVVPRSIDALLEEEKRYSVYTRTTEQSHWLDIHRSEFQEVALENGTERAIARRELELIVPSGDISTNSAMVACLVRDKKSGEVMIGVQKISGLHSQYASVQERAGHSGLVTLPGYHLPSDVRHIQNVPAWIANRTGVDVKGIKQLGEGHFPSMGVMPNRVFPFVITDVSDEVRKKLDFISLREAFTNIEKLHDLHLINAVFRATHALGLWDEYASPLRPAL